jgi:hypothetical protein
MSATGSVNITTNIREVLPAGGGYSASKLDHSIATFAGLTVNKSFGGTGDPTWEIPWSGTVSLTGGAATLDLTNLTRDDPFEIVDMAGKSIVYAAFAGAAANTAKITVRDGGTNGYLIFGSATAEIDVFPNMVIEMTSFVNADLAAIVNSTNDTIDFAGTGTEQIHVVLCAGV